MVKISFKMNLNEFLWNFQERATSKAHFRKAPPLIPLRMRAEADSGSPLSYLTKRGREQGTVALPAMILRRGDHGGDRQLLEWTQGSQGHLHVPAEWKEVVERRGDGLLQ